MIPQRTIRPSIARANEQLDPRSSMPTYHRPNQTCIYQNNQYYSFQSIYLSILCLSQWMDICLIWTEINIVLRIRENGAGERRRRFRHAGHFSAVEFRVKSPEMTSSSTQEIQSMTRDQYESRGGGGNACGQTCHESSGSNRSETSACWPLRHDEHFTADRYRDTETGVVCGR